LTGEFNVNEIHLEFLVRLHANEQGGATPSGNDFIWVMNRFKNESKGPLEFFKDGLYQVGESQALVSTIRIVDVLGKDSNCLSIGLGFELVSSLLKDGS